jgi:hypothetical protein
MIVGLWGVFIPPGPATIVIFFLSRFISKIDRPELTLSPSIVAPPSLKQILDSNHQNLREKAAKLDWRADLLIPKV